MVGDLKSTIPELLLGCELMKIPINILDRTKMTDILITAVETLDGILDMKEGGCVTAEYVNSYREMD